MKITKNQLRKVIRESILLEFGHDWEEDCFRMDGQDERDCERRNADRRFEMEKMKKLSSNPGAFKGSRFMQGMSNVDRRVDVLEDKVDQINMLVNYH